MTALSVIKLTALILCCILATISDTREGIISNKLIAVFGIVGLSLDVLTIWFSSAYENRLFLLNAGSMILIAFTLYFLHIWAGGDCKLLVVIALLFPPELYWRFDSTEFTLWYSLGFMFGIGFIYILIESIALWLINDKGKWSSDFLEAFKHTLFQYIKAMIYISALSHIYNYFIFPHVRIPNVVMSIAFILFFWKIRSYEFYNSLPLTAFIAVFDLCMTLFTGTVTVSTNWITYVIVLTFMVLRLFVSKYNYQIINTEDIKRGMILSQVSSLLMQNSRIEGMPSVSDESLDSRLTIEEAESIVRWSKTKNGLKQITIVRKIPFAVFITSGALAYLLARGVLK